MGKHFIKKKYFESKLFEDLNSFLSCFNLNTIGKDLLRGMYQNHNLADMRIVAVGTILGSFWFLRIGLLGIFITIIFPLDQTFVQSVRYNKNTFILLFKLLII